MSDLLADIAQHADDLCNPRRHVEVIEGRDHNHNKKTVRRITNVPSLLDQLAAAVQPGETYVEGEATHTAYASRPPARLDAIDRYLAIQASAARWCQSVDLHPRDRPDHNIRALVGKAPTLDHDTQRTLWSEMSAWKTWAETVTGWIRPPDAPRAPCPICDKRGTLRVRLQLGTACCMACAATWDRGNITLLADHVRAYLAASEAAGEVARLKAANTRRAEEARRSGAA